MSTHRPVNLTDCKLYWKRAEAEFRAWKWEPETPGKAVIYERDARTARPMHGGARVLIELGVGTRWRCTLCKAVPSHPVTSLHWTNWGRVQLHMILHHGGTPR